MKAVEVVFYARDEQDATEINADLEASGVLNDWPVVAWETREATEGEREWFAVEYGEGDDST